MTAGQGARRKRERPWQGQDLHGKSGSMLTVIELSDVNGTPQVKRDIDVLLRIGDPLALKLRVERNNNGRREVLVVDQRFRVEAVGVDASTTPVRQVLSVSSYGKPPTWRAVKKTALGRRLGPARHPRTKI